MNAIHYNNCPVCSSGNIQFVFSAKDNTVSQQLFEIWQCNDCTLRFTQDVPAENEIGRYYQSENYISHTDTSKGLINRIYKAVRKKTLRKKRKLVCLVTGLTGGKVLDIGSGAGAFASEMMRNGWNVTALEPDEKARTVARKNFGIELQPPDKLFALTAGSFDAITLWHVLEHVHLLHEYMQQMKNLLKKNGRVIIAVPNYTSKDADVYKQFWAAYDVPRHLYHFSPKAMQMLAGLYNLKIEAYKPMWFDSFYVSLLSSRYKSGKTSWLSAMWNGFRSNLKAVRDKKKCSSVIYVLAK